MFELFAQMMALIVYQRPLLFQEGVCIFAAGPAQRQGDGDGINAGSTGGVSASRARFQAFRFFHPTPAALDLRPLRQTGTRLATGARFLAESLLFLRQVPCRPRFGVPISPDRRSPRMSALGQTRTLAQRLQTELHLRTISGPG